MIKFVLIPPGSRSPFTPLGGLRRRKLLTKSRGYRARLKHLACSAKRRKELREWSRNRGHYVLSLQPIWSSDPDDPDVAVANLLCELDDGLNKPSEQITLEWWLSQRRQVPRRFPRNP
jgi:hypothetical protein